MSILVLTSDTLIGTPATGNLEYNGQFYGTDSNASRAQMQRITQGTAVASTSGTSIDFTGIPSWVKRITVMFNGVSTSGTANYRIQLGTGGAPTTTGYSGTASWLTSGGSSTVNAYSAGFDLNSNTSATTLQYGVFVFLNLTGNTWVASGVGAQTTSANSTQQISGVISLSGTLNLVRITTVGSPATDTFDAGSVNILYEG